MAQLPFQKKSTSNLRIKKISTAPDSVLLENVSIVPSTFSVQNIDTSFYRLDYIHSYLFWKKKPSSDSVLVMYRTFPFKMDAVAQRFNFDSIANNVYLQPFEFNDNKGTAGKTLIDFGNIQYNGSFGRELSFGNSQNAVVNSTFQLQLSGMLKDSIEIAAALTDNNIPVQPDGTTKQLSEFDQVYLQFKKKNWQLNLGDIDIRQNQMYFLKFYKRLQGISFQTLNAISPTVQLNSLVSGSIAKGKFNRNIFQGLEGNQGPYRLTGANNEIFFIVLANTEKVFLDGELLQRGEDQDYIINYNTAEVTFMPKRMITKDSRIQIEFEYADRNYLNANLYLNEELTINNKLKIRLGAFSNSDAKNSSINQTLDPKQKQFLFDLGDSIQKAYYPNAVTDTFANGKILYQRVYDTVNNVVDSFYRYSTNQSVVLYNLSFTNVGQGNGDYIPDFNGANGKVYKFVPRINGVKQGQFDPVIILVTPKKQQLISVGTEYRIDKNNSVNTELALSNYDVNTFSNKDKGDNLGLAARFQFNNSTMLNNARKLELNSSVDYEYVQDRFHPIERLRYVEFTREWGLPLVLNPATENILRLSSQLRNTKQAITYQFMTYQRSDNYKGYQNLLQQTGNINGWIVNNQFAITNFTTGSDKGSYLRPIIDVSKQFASLYNTRLGFRYASEKNEIRNKVVDSLSVLSFAFDTYSVYLKTDERKKNKYAVTFFTRSDRNPQLKQLTKTDRSYNINFDAQLLQSAKHQLIFNAGYRILNVYNKTLTNQSDDKTLLGRAEYLVNEWKGFLTGNALYELGTGQEQKRDYTYIEVPPGQGQYTWIDYNNDNIQQLNEFEIALFPDQAKYVRIFVPTNIFVKANYITLNYNVNLNPKALYNGTPTTEFAKILTRFNFQSSMQKSKKSVAKGDFEFNPFRYDVLDTALLTLTTSFLNNLSFNRFSNKWGIDLSNVQNTGKSLLTYGYESRKLIDWIAKIRYNITTTIVFDITGKRGLNALYTPSFSNRNYELHVSSEEPRIALVKGTKFRLQTSYKYEEKENQPLYGGEKSYSNSINLETKYNILQNSSVTGRFTFNDIKYKYPVNTTVSYIMLDGLLPGSNYLWSLEFTKRLLNNVEINFQYEGRKPGESRTIHVGRASIRALF
jgi:hypothetical protein